MSCHGCAAKFTILNKEHGCANCGFSYCSKCLKYKIVVPKLGNREQKVCRSCYTALSELATTAEISKEEYCPPETFLRRLESLENPSRPPITLYRPDQRMKDLKSGMDKADLEIVERLEKLRDERKQQPVPTEDEVFKRLAILKGEDPTRMTATHKAYLAPDTRTNDEKADSLFQQYIDEHGLDCKRPDAVTEITQRLEKLQETDAKKVSENDILQRLAKLRGQDVVNQPSSCEQKEDNMPMTEDDVSSLVAELKKEMKDHSHQIKKQKRDAEHSSKATKLKVQVSSGKPTEEHEESSDEEVEKTIQKALAEVALEDKVSDDSESDEKEEELPWCIICNENATLRCLDCDNDLYCNSCFKQGHDEWEMQEHRTMPYKPHKRAD